MVNFILKDKIEKSKDVLKVASEMSLYYYNKPLILTYSGGKDSDVIVQLAEECLKPSDFEVLNSHTTIDAPETVYYIRDRFKELEGKGIKTTIQLPRDKDGNLTSIWKLIEKKQIPPTRFMRYCCADLKEANTPNRYIATGVRQSESVGRRGRDVFSVMGKDKKSALHYSLDHIKEVFETSKAKQEGDDRNVDNVWDCTFIAKAKRNEDLICNPIYEWTDSEVWEFIEDRKMEHNPLYDKGFTRVGCIGCPLASNQVKELEMYPKYKANYILAFDRMMQRRRESGKKDYEKEGTQKWTDGESVYKWWINDTSMEGQMSIFDFIKEE